MLPQVVIEALRSGVPTVGAIVGPVLARQQGKDVATIGHIAGYSLAGWSAGYFTQKLLFWALDRLGERSLPTEVSSLQGLAAPTPAPQAAPKVEPKIPEAALRRMEQTPAEAKNEGVREVDAKDNVVPMKIQSHIDEAYGTDR